MPVPQSASSSSLRGRQWRSSTNYAQALSSSSTSCGRPTLPGFQPRVPACQCVPPSSAVDLHIDTRTAQRQAPPRLALDDEPSSQFGSLGPVGHGGQLSLHPGGTHPEGEPTSTFGQDRPPLPPNTEELDIIMVPSSPRACVTVLLQQDLNSPSGPARYLTDSSSSDSDADTAWQEPLDQNLQTVLQLSTAGMLAASAYQHMPPCQDCLEALTSPGATSAAGLQPPTLGPPAGTESVIAAAAAAAATSMLPLPVGPTSSNSSSSSSSTDTPGSSTPSLGMPITTAAAALTTAITTATIASGSSSSSSSSAAPAIEQGQEHVCSPAKLWALGLLAACYVHQASTSFSIPVMLPMVSSSLHLTDLEGAMLTTGYSYLYALALVPMGMLVDRVSARPALLGTAVAVWSGLTMVAAQANSFSELMAARVGLAAAQSAQNVVCFGMIPELFPTTRSTAMAFYNCAIYLGRGLMYLVTNAARELLSHQPAAIDAASQALIQYDAYGNILVPLDKLDLRLAQLVYTIGDMAAIRATAPLYELSQAATGLEDSAWRQVLEQLAVPGLFISAALLLTVRETRKASKSDSSSPAASGPQAQPGADATSNSAIIATAADAVAPAGTSRPGQQERSGPFGWLSRLWHKQQGVASAALPGPDAAAQAPAAAAATSSSSSSSSGKASVWSLASNKPFLTITAAAALNDFGSYAFIGWQSTFYERAYHLEITQYAPVLATILPLAGIIGGVGGGLLADRLSKSGKRYWVTVATSLMAAPLLWASLTADTAEHSFLFLGLGFALSEGWRAPAAVMCRGVAPPEISSTAISLYLCLRNLLGGLGPLMIAHVATGVDLQLALQLLPPVYFASGLLFWAAESQIAAASAAADKTLAAQSTSTSGSSGVSSSMDASAVAGAHTGGVAGSLARSIGMEGAAAALASRDERHAGTSGPDAASGAAAAGTTAVTAGAPQPVPIPLPVAPEQQRVQVPTRV